MPFHLLPEHFVRSAAALERAWPLSDALAYTRWLATHHYENFHVVSFLLPKRLHQDFYNVYSFCRWADDLGDEIGEKEESLRLLTWWQEQLDSMYAGRASHPVFVALQGTVAEYAIPKQPFADLIQAFVQDQVVTRYADMPALHRYCTYSANPVGHLVLYLCGYRDAERQSLSDFTCTALQLANHWQDVSVDLRKDRVYIPQNILTRHGCSDADLFAGRESPEFVNVMREIVEHAREMFHKGLPLVRMVNRRLSVDLDLFSRGGLRILDKIEQQGYRVLHRRPSVSKRERVGLLLSALARVALPRTA